jgi:hypothetical protein
MINEKLDLPEEEPGLEEPPKPEASQPQEQEDEDENEKIRRQVGDSTLWTYYLKSFGVSSLCVVVLLCLTSNIGSKFPRRFTILRKLALTEFRNLAEIHHR